MKSLQMKGFLFPGKIIHKAWAAGAAACNLFFFVARNSQITPHNSFIESMVRTLGCTQFRNKN
jgi:hypothetical protein